MEFDLKEIARLPKKLKLSLFVTALPLGVWFPSLEQTLATG